MSGVLAVLGFWTFLIVLALRKPISAAIAARAIPSSGAGNSKEVEVLRARVQTLESALSSVQSEVLELHDANQFMQKLLTDKSKSAPAAPGAVRWPAPQAR